MSMPPGQDDSSFVALTEERNAASHDIDRLSTQAICRLINRQDAATPLAVAESLPEIAQAVDCMVEALASGHRVFYVGAGTSGRLGVLDASELLPTFSLEPGRVVALMAGGDRALRHSVEAAEDDAAQGKNDLQAHQLQAGDVVVGIAASGRTPYVIGALQYAQEAGARTIAIVCSPRSRMAEQSQISIEAIPGPEVITGSTRMKAGTVQKMVLNILSTASMVKLGKVYGNLMVDVQITNAKLAERAIRIVGEAAAVDRGEAERLLDRADSEVKTAIVMGLLGCTAEEARGKLDSAGGVVRRTTE
jgi:N-acetylmuramic acid 6-phosphate etherase